MKQASVSMMDHGGGKRRVGIRSHARQRASPVVANNAGADGLLF